MGQPVVHFEISGQDRPALVHFYEQLFGWTMTDLPESDYALVDTGGGGGINGGIGRAPAQTAGGVTVYVETDDIAASLARAEELGGRTIAGPIDMPDGHRWAMFADPEGHAIGLYGTG